MKQLGKNDVRRLFWKCGTCSRTFACLLNREFGHPDDHQERATDLLAGGLLQTGNQCGMLWGATLAAGAESSRRHSDRAMAMTAAVEAARSLLASFFETSGTVQCREVTGCNLNTPLGLAKLIAKTFLGGILYSPCFNLAEAWGHKAVQSATETIACKFEEIPESPTNCAREVVKQLGGTEEEAAMVAGYAGGLGLSGNACGALAAAVWFKTLAWCRLNPGKTPPYFNNPNAKATMSSFRTKTNGELLCEKICGKKFESLSEHSEFVKTGGCKELILALAQA